MKKRLLSLILAAIMVAAMLPAAFAADESTIVYEFNSRVYGLETGLAITKTVEKTQSDIASGYNRWNIEGLAWVIDSSTLTEDYLYLHAAQGRVTDTDNSIIVSAAIALNINETGTFSPSITYIPEASAPIYDVYLVKKDSSDDVKGFASNKNNADLTKYIQALAETELLGTVNMYSTDSTQKTEPLKTVNITETGDYYLILAEKGADSSFTANTELHVNGRVTTKLCSFSLTPAEKAEDVVSAFEVTKTDATHSASMSALYAAADGSAISASASCSDEDEDGVYLVTAGEADSTGEYTFLYWVKGLTQDKTNKIVSFNREFSYKPQQGGNYLIAVYEKADSEEATAKAEFYNGNGQLLYTTAEDSDDENNVTVENGTITIPELPTMAGYPTATHWELYGDADKVRYGAGSNLTAGLSGTMIFVAQYDDVYVNVNDKSVRYGDSITFTADSEKGEFKWWQRTANGASEIVSVEKEYTFYPWENCTVEGVYSTEKQITAGSCRKIILDALGADGIMAEFIGLDGTEVVEKGIVLGGKKVAMSSNGSQLTVTNNIEAASAYGYAIIKSGTAYTEITDGEVTLGE